MKSLLGNTKLKLNLLTWTKRQVFMIRIKIKKETDWRVWHWQLIFTIYNLTLTPVYSASHRRKGGDENIQYKLKNDQLNMSCSDLPPYLLQELPDITESINYPIKNVQRIKVSENILVSGLCSKLFGCMSYIIIRILIYRFFDTLIYYTIINE